MVNSLTRQTGARLGPLLFETLVKHYFERLAKESLVRNGVTVTTKLRKEELLYDEAYIIVKTFLEAASKHPVEELQRFSNTRTPSPPWVHVVRLVVPMSCCDDAAEIVVKALGGEEMTKRLVGGTKWWQVRGVKGVDAEWIATKKDWQESEKKHKAHEKDKSRSSSNSPQIDGEEAPAEYDPDMDEMRCILYSHGGGYYFGSVDQERYAIQRLARKINGRVFAINYRLAPQYPFPCGLQDLIAAYLYLIRPPEGAAHRAVKPEHIIVSGDSAGGGLTLALLQVLRDCDIPLPAGGVLVSPWCDLTHSFPSIHTNTATDVIPPYGLSFYKPSTLWPPPPDDMTITVREGLRSRIRQAVTLTTDPKADATLPGVHGKGNGDGRSRSRSRVRPVSPLPGEHDLRLPQTGQTLHLGSTASLPTVAAGVKDQTVHCVTEAGEELSIHEQIHLYTPNYLLAHPLVSPAMSYMGGLPPLLIIAGDAEVLRDEIIYLAHKAAHPEQYPISQQAREMYPALKGIEERINRPTPVHLQVYDDAAHVLPILFSFTTPAKYCFRAMALFIRQVTGMMPSSGEEIDIPITLSPPDSPDADDVGGDGSTRSLPAPQVDADRLSRPTSTTPHSRSSPPSRDGSPVSRRRSLFRGRRKPGEEDASGVVTTSSMKRSFRRSLFLGSASAEPSRERRSNGAVSSDGDDSPRASSIDVGGPRFRGSGVHHEADVRRAGEESVYLNGLTEMIRERVSTHGIIRPLEPESELSAFSLPPERIGQVSELAMRRFFDAKTKFDKKFGRTYKSIEKHRLKHIERAKKDAMRNMTQLQNYINQDEKREGETLKGVKEGLVASGSWSWAWALDVDEKPPPSSIVARRDTHEAVELARIADQAVLADEDMLSGNSLWSLMVNFLTVVPDKEKRKEELSIPCVESRESKRERVRSRFAQVFTDLKKHHRSAAGPPSSEAPPVPTSCQKTSRTSRTSVDSARSDDA